MVEKLGGFRRKTRHKLKKHFREKGKISVRKYFQTFDKGDKVYLSADSAVHKGMYFPKYHGKVGKIKDKAGECYSVEISDKNKVKTLIVHPIHLKSVK